MPSNQIIAYGATVERSTNGTTWTAIPECQGVAVPVVTQEYPEVTSLDSPNGFREYIKGLKDAGEVTVPCGYTAAGFDQQTTDNAAPDAIHYRVTLRPQPNQSTGDRFIFRGFPTPKLQDTGLGEPMGIEITIRTTGSITWIRGTAAA